MYAKGFSLPKDKVDALNKIDNMRLMGVLTVLALMDANTAERQGDFVPLLLDLNVSQEVAFLAAQSRTDEIVDTYDEDEPPEVLADRRHRHGLAAYSWLDGFIAGARWQRVLSTGDDERPKRPERN